VNIARVPQLRLDENARRAMRRLAFATALLAIGYGDVSAEISAASPGSYASKMDDQNRQFLKDLEAKVRRTGYRDPTVVPQLFLVKATDKSGRPVTLLVDSDTEQAIEVKVPAELTGSRPKTWPLGR
jgi:hypothetical protein